MFPNLVELHQEFVVIINVAQLCFGVAILLERPVRQWRSQHEMSAFRGNSIESSSISEQQVMGSRYGSDRVLNLGYGLHILGKPWNRGLDVFVSYFCNGYVGCQVDAIRVGRA